MVYFDLISVLKTFLLGNFISNVISKEISSLNGASAFSTVGLGGNNVKCLQVKTIRV